MQLNLPAGAEEKLLAYVALLSKWNRTYNLTSVRDEMEMVSHHLLDSLAVLPYLEHIDRLADVGSGAGLPGMALAIANPEVAVTSIEASQKKAAFQQQVKIELGVSNVSVYCGRVEELKTDSLFSAVISRAFSSLAEFTRLAGALVVEGGTLLAMKGQRPDKEITELPSDWKVAELIRLAVPGLAAERHLLALKRA
jgi:16S rRNA (guanine527-N7)-methyltransferase